MHCTTGSTRSRPALAGRLRTLETTHSTMDVRACPTRRETIPHYPQTRYPGPLEQPPKQRHHLGRTMCPTPLTPTSLAIPPRTWPRPPTKPLGDRRLAHLSGRHVRFHPTKSPATARQGTITPVARIGGVFSLPSVPYTTALPPPGSMRGSPGLFMPHICPKTVLEFCGTPLAAFLSRAKAPRNQKSRDSARGRFRR